MKILSIYSIVFVFFINTPSALGMEEKTRNVQQELEHCLKNCHQTDCKTECNAEYLKKVIMFNQRQPQKASIEHIYLDTAKTEYGGFKD